MSPRWFLGLSSGSGLAGVDAAIVRADGAGASLALRFEQAVQQPYSKDVRELLGRLSAEQPPAPRQLGVLHRVLGEAFAAAARLAVEQGKQPVLCAGLSGHTLWHDGDGRYPSTLNLGMAAAVAERTGLTVVSDFRSRDVVLGGQGEPSAALVDALLFRNPSEARLLLHLGGVATVLWLPPEPGLRGVIGFEAGPCSLLLDGLMQLLTAGREPFDPGGRYAVQGRCLEPLLERWLAHPFFRRKPPRGVPRDEYGPAFLNQAVQHVRQSDGTLHDLLCTATHFAVRAIVDSIRRYLPAAPARVLVSGGGARNGFLWRLLEQQLAPVPMEKLDAHGVPAEARRAVGCAGLAALALDGLPANVPAATGAAGPRLLGSFTPGSPANWSRCLAWMASQTAHQQIAA